MSNEWMGQVGDALASGLKGAAAGSVVPGIGTAIGGIAGLATSLVPTIGKWIFGDDGAAVTKAVGDVAQALTGTATSDDAAAAIAADPAASEAFRLEVLKIAAQREADQDRARNAHLAVEAADRADARNHEDPIKRWLAGFISLTFLAAAGLMFFHAAPAGSETYVSLLIGALVAKFSDIVSYYFGSSAGSAAKDVRLAARE